MVFAKILRSALPLVTYVSAVAVGVGFAAYQDARKRKNLEAADAFSTGRDVGADPSVAPDNLPSDDSGARAAASRTYPFADIGE